MAAAVAVKRKNMTVHQPRRSLLSLPPQRAAGAIFDNMDTVDLTTNYQIIKKSLWWMLVKREKKRNGPLILIITKSSRFAKSSVFCVVLFRSSDGFTLFFFVTIERFGTCFFFQSSKYLFDRLTRSSNRVQM